MIIYKVVREENGDYDYSDYGYPQSYYNIWLFKREKNAKQFFDEKIKSIREFLGEHAELFDGVDEYDTGESCAYFDMRIKRPKYSDRFDGIWPFAIDHNFDDIMIQLEIIKTYTED